MKGKHIEMIYPTSANDIHPSRHFASYRSTLKRSPTKALIPMRHTLSELTGPVYGHEKVREHDHDLTVHGKSEPIGERIIVHGHVLDEDSRGVPDALVELWQANAWALRSRGRPASGAARSELHRSWPRADGSERPLQLRHNQARRLPVGQPSQRLASGPHPLLRVRSLLRAW